VSLRGASQALHRWRAHPLRATQVTAADLKYSADARAGVATAFLAPSSISVSIVGVTITYADGVRESAVLVNMQAMGGPSTWRIDVG